MHVLCNTTPPIKMNLATETLNTTSSPQKKTVNMIWSIFNHHQFDRYFYVFFVLGRSPLSTSNPPTPGASPLSQATDFCPDDLRFDESGAWMSLNGWFTLLDVPGSYPLGWPDFLEKWRYYIHLYSP